MRIPQGRASLDSRRLNPSDGTPVTVAAASQNEFGSGCRRRFFAWASRWLKRPNRPDTLVGVLIDFPRHSSQSQPVAVSRGPLTHSDQTGTYLGMPQNPAFLGDREAPHLQDGWAYLKS